MPISTILAQTENPASQFVFKCDDATAFNGMLADEPPELIAAFILDRSDGEIIYIQAATIAHLMVSGNSERTDFEVAQAREMTLTVMRTGHAKTHFNHGNGRTTEIQFDPSNRKWVISGAQSRVFENLLEANEYLAGRSSVNPVNRLRRLLDSQDV